MNIEDYFDTFRFILYQFIEDNELGYLWIEYSSGKICFDVAKGLAHIPISSYGEIPKIDGVSEENILEHLNSLELKRAKEALGKVKTILKEIPSSKDHISQRKYYENVIGEYLIWYDRNGLECGDVQQKPSIDTSIVKEDKDDAMWAIADDMRERKDQGEFPTYRDAYKWAADHWTHKGKDFKGYQLERAYHKAKSENKVD